MFHGKQGGVGFSGAQQQPCRPAASWCGYRTAFRGLGTVAQSQQSGHLSQSTVTKPLARLHTEVDSTGLWGKLGCGSTCRTAAMTAPILGGPREIPRSVHKLGRRFLLGRSCSSSRPPSATSRQGLLLSNVELKPHTLPSRRHSAPPRPCFIHFRPQPSQEPKQSCPQRWGCLGVGLAAGRMLNLVSAIQQVAWELLAGRAQGHHLPILVPRLLYPTATVENTMDCSGESGHSFSLSLRFGTLITQGKHGRSHQP